MSATVEITNNNIKYKIKEITSILDKFETYNIRIDPKIIYNFDAVNTDYNIGVVNILSEYFLLSDTCNSNNKERVADMKIKYFNVYQNFIKTENIISKLDRIITNIKKYVKNICDQKIQLEINDCIKKYNSKTIELEYKDTSYAICKCSIKMDIDTNSSSLICKSCGYIKELYGTSFTDDSCLADNSKQKYGNYDPSKHCRFWVDRIQAKENTEIDPAVINSIKSCIKRDKNLNKNNISCANIRKYLFETKYSKYNDHIPLIRRIITGVTPPQLTDINLHLIHIYFDKVIHIFENTKHNTKTNCPYHPYFIYKIIEQIMNKESQRKEKNDILSCIHLQSRETLIQNDIIWKYICDKIPEFTYIPTDRTLQYFDL